MNKTVNINLAGIIFHVDEDAYAKLTDYLRKVRTSLQDEEGFDEIIADIESRIAEIFQEMLSDTKQVINMKEVDHVIEVLGTPEDFQENAENAEPQAQEDTYFYTGKKLFRNSDDKMLGGVASGIAAYFGIDTVWVRLILILFAVFSFGTMVIIYLILWAVIPEALTTAQKLQMRGEPVTISNIEKSVKQGIKDFESKVNNMANKAKQPKFRNSVQQIIDSFIDILQYLGKFILKVLGAFLLFWGFIGLIGFIALLFGSDVLLFDQINGLGIWEYGNAIFTSNLQRNSLLAGITLMSLFPIAVFILIGIRILVGPKFNGRFIGGTFGLGAFIGVLLIVFSGISLGRDFKEDASLKKRTKLETPTDNKFYLTSFPTEFNDNGGSLWLPNMENQEWLITDKDQRLKSFSLKIERTAGDIPFIEIVSESRGRSRKQAYERAGNYTYGFQQIDNKLYFSDYFSIPRSEKFRDQELEIIVFLPDSTLLEIDESLIDILSYTRNEEGYPPSQLVGSTWIMTADNLECLDCPEDAVWEDEEDENYDIELRINDEEGIKLDIEPSKKKESEEDEDQSTTYQTNLDSYLEFASFKNMVTII